MMVKTTASQRYVPLGLRREDAATFIGVGPTKFDEIDQPYLSGPVLMRETGRLDRPVVTTGA